jgi:hypothetical protein
MAPRRGAGPAGALPPGALPDAAGREWSGPFDPGRDRRPYPGRRLGAAALGGPSRVRAVRRGCHTGASNHRCRRIGIAAGTERRVPDVQLAGAARDYQAARVAAGRRRGPAGPLAGPPAAGREPVQSERAVHHTGRSACRGERGAAAAAARGRRRDRGAGAVHRLGRRRSSPRSAGRACPAPQRRCPYASLRSVRHSGIRLAVPRGAERRRGRRDRGRGATREGPGGTGWHDPDAQPDHPRGGDSAGDRVARGDRDARHAGTGAKAPG